MTLIIAVKTNEGILVASDSIVTKEGYYLTMKNFSEELAKKGTVIESEDKIFSPKEILDFARIYSRDTFNRISSSDNIDKIFKLSDYCSLLVSGLSDLNEIPIKEVCRKLKEDISKNISDNNFATISDYTYGELKKELDKETSYSKESSHYIFAGYDPISDKYKVDEYRYNDYQKIDGSKITVVRNFDKFSNDKKFLFFAGASKDINSLNNINENQVHIDDNLNLIIAYEISMSILNIVSAFEKISYGIPSVGGNMNFGIITKKGFKFITEKIDILNV